MTACQQMMIGSGQRVLIGGVLPIITETNSSVLGSYCTLRFSNDGNVYGITSQGGGNWTKRWLGVGSAANYWLKVVQLSGTYAFSAGNNVWLQMNAIRNWDVTYFAIGSQTATYNWYMNTVGSDTGIIASGSGTLQPVCTA